MMLYGGVNMVDVNSTIELRLSSLEKQVDNIDNSLKDKSDRLLTLENTQKVILEKLDNVSKHTEAIVGMSYEVINLASKVGEVVELIEKQEIKIDKQNKRIDEIEKKPGKVALSTITFIISTIVSTGIGALIGMLIK